jgi:hypothetical protein
MLLFFSMFLGCSDIGYKDQIDKIFKKEKTTSTCNNIGVRELVLEINKQPKNPVLSGEPIMYKGQKIPVVVISDFSGGFYGGYPNIKPRGDIPWHWNTPEYSDILENGVLSFSGPATYYPMLASLGVLFPQQKGQDKKISLSSYNKNKNNPILPSGLKPYTSTKSVIQAIANKRFEGNKRTSFNSVGRDSDFAHALKVASKIMEATPEKSGVVWLLTDNINEMANSDSSTDADFTKQFYQYLSANPKWQIIQTYTINKGDFLNGTSFVVYGMLYSGRDLLTQEAYDSWTRTPGSPLEQDRLKNVFQKYSTTTGHPIRMKPTYLDLATVHFDGTPTCQLAEQGKKRKCTIKARITNQLEHRTITKAKIKLVNKSMLPYRCKEIFSSDISKCKKNLELFYQAEPIKKDALDISLTLDKPIGPQETKNYTWKTTVAPIDVKHSSLQDAWMSAKTEELIHQGFIEIQITDIETEITKVSAESIFGGENIPTFFKDFKANTNTVECLQMKTKNPNSIWAFVIIGVFSAVVFGVVFVLERMRSIHLTVTGDIKKQYTSANPLLLRPLMNKEILLDPEGNPLMEISLDLKRKVKYKDLGNNQISVNLYDYEIQSSSSDYGNVTYNVRIAPLGADLMQSSGLSMDDDDY